MDHDHGTEGATCPMIMTFHGGHCETILWKGWVASTVVQFVFSALAIFAIAFAYELLKFIREYLLRQTVKKEAQRMALELKSKSSNNHHGGSDAGDYSNTPLAELKDKPYLQRITTAPHLIQSLLNLLQIAISYWLMLVFMLFNYYLCLAAILGLGFGYFFFGWIKQDAYEAECCH